MSLYRNTAFLFKGLREFTKSGYTSASKSFDASALEVDMSSQAFMITGANSGIGKAAAVALAKKGGTVHMVCRNTERGEAAKQEIIDDSGNQNIHLHIVDMSDPKKVFQFASEFVESGKPLNVLVNNAGCMVNDREVTADGLEKNFATNTMGTYLLTTTLIPCLSQQPFKPRVITVSSGGMYTQKLDLTNLQSDNGSFDGTMVYAHQKRQQIIMTEQWAKKFPEIHFSVMHPGWADTPAVRTSMPGFYNSMKNKLRTPEEGADTIVWLAVAEAAVNQPSGQFYLDRKPQSTHLSLAWTRSKPEEEEKLMTVVEEMAKKFKM
ncbi:dehydrogenase/reductase SDR family member 12-like [Amphiura filiformis]|uniref:dehydrogenase/reductase SDR family member 12-like n=1 Tax=Amphiura filiformis TaxID=82378 RepID=UPI003B222D9A